MEGPYTIGEFTDNSCEIKLTRKDQEVFQLDNPDVLLEIRPKYDEYGAFYSAKGRQWDIWYRSDDADGQSGVEFAMRYPVQAVRGLLARPWRADFGFDPNEED